MIVEIYHTASEYSWTGTWNTPTRTVVRTEDYETYITWIPCRDCAGTGHFPVPWQPGDKPPFRLGGSGRLVPDDFCVACKGTGVEPVSI